MAKAVMNYTVEDMKALISDSGYKGLFIYIVIILARPPAAGFSISGFGYSFTL